MATAYEGNQPYIFVSYSHKDKPQVMGFIVRLLIALGLNVLPFLIAGCMTVTLME